METNNRTEVSQEILAAAAESLDLPRSLLPGLPVLQIVCGSEVLVENHGGSLEYADELIRVSGKNQSFSVRGLNLELRSMTREHIRITGKITEITFE